MDPVQSGPCLVHHESQYGADVRIAVDKIRRAVDGVDDPGFVGRQCQFFTTRHAFLSYEESRGESLSQTGYQHFLNLLVRLCHQVIVGALLAR